MEFGWARGGNHELRELTLIFLKGLGVGGSHKFRKFLGLKWAREQYTLVVVLQRAVRASLRPHTKPQNLASNFTEWKLVAR